MKKEDKLAIVAFSDFPHIKLELTEMTEENKQKAFKAIDEIYAVGGTDIYDGLRTGLDLITNDYISGDRVVSMILLSDGLDYNSNADKRFKDYINNQGKQNYAFILHTLGYGDEHDAN